MYGICNECGHQEESSSAKCAGCGHSWHLFPTRPRDQEVWLRPKSYWDRARRCFPPPVIRTLFLGLFFFIALTGLDIWAVFNKIHLPTYKPLIYSGITVFDLICCYLALKTLRVSMKHYKRLKWLILTSVAFTTILFLHTIIQVIGYEPRLGATTYLCARFMLVVFTGFIFLRSRIFRALLRHG